MSFFIKYSSITVKLCYFVCLAIYIFYFIDKWKRTKLIFSSFNFQIIFFCFVLFVVSPFQYNYSISNTWSFLGTADFLLRLDEAYIVNLVGFSIMGVTMIYFEKKSTNLKAFYRILDFAYSNSSSKYMYILCALIGTVYIIYIVIKAHGVPIFNGSRFMTNSAQFLYLLLNAMVYCCAWYCVGSLSKKVSIKMTIILGILCFALLITGNRTPILKVMYAGLILHACSREKINYATVFKQFKYVILVLLVGVVIIAARNGSNIASIAEIIGKYIIYGSTFCDVRDGARVCYGYHNMYSAPLLGKTYIAALLSFVPSSVSGIPILSDIAEFRRVYSGGTWSTYTLFGISNHYGLRGGMFLPGYFNFGSLGIIIVAVILGYWFGNCEKFFVRLIRHKEQYDVRRWFFSYCFTSMIFELLYAPTTFNSMWGYLVVLIILMCSKGKIILRSRKIEVSDYYEK